MNIDGTGAVPIKGVIFDFHGTLVAPRDADLWIDGALRRTAQAGGPVPALSAAERSGLHDYLDRIWEHAHAIDPDSSRDLSHARHVEVFSRTVARCPGVGPELITALYDVMTEQWPAFDDAGPVLRRLRERGVRVVLLSNIGTDVRPNLEGNGISELFDDIVLSYEVGLVKPNPAIFQLALDRLAVPADQALMVGDNARDDAGGAVLGIRTLILPRTTGPVHGLGSVLRLID
jgi:HAD superfamily hydrolase (TIGR01509 family)